MKKIITLVLLAIAIVSYSQKLEKIKGNKNVILSERIFEELNALELNKNIDLIVMNGSENKLEIYADDNLHEIVETDLRDGRLSISLTNKISTKKKFELTLHLTDSVLEQLVLNENSKITNKDFLTVNNIKVVLNDRAEANLLLNTESITLELNDHAKGEMSLKGKESVINLQESSKLKVIATFDNMNVKSDQKSSVTLTGKVESLVIEAKNTSKVKATNLKVDITKVIAENSASIYTNTSTTLIISAESKSKIYIYGNPEIKLTSFKGMASLFKKE